MIETIALTSLDGTDFDRIFDDCYDNLSVDYPWGGCETYEERKAHLRHLMEHRLTGHSPDGGTYLCLRTSQDGYDLALAAGVVRDGHYTIWFGLLGKDPNGSRAYNHTTEYQNSSKSFYAANGITSREYQVVTGSRAETLLLTKWGYADTGRTVGDGTVKIVNGD